MSNLKKAGLASILVLCAVLGWWRAGSIINKSTIRADNWQTLIDIQIPPIDYGQVARQVRNAEIFPSAITAQSGNSGSSSGTKNTGKLSRKIIPPFPKITGMTKIDRTRAVILILEDNRVISARVGDVIDNGWEISSLAPTLVKASYNGKITEFPVLNYDRKSGRKEYLQMLKDEKKANKYKQ